MAVDWTGYRLTPDLSGLAQGIAQYGANKQQAAQFQQEMDYKNRALAAEIAKSGIGGKYAPKGQNLDVFAVDEQNNVFAIGSEYDPNTQAWKDSYRGLNDTNAAPIGAIRIVSKEGLPTVATGIAAASGAKVSAEEGARTKALKERESVLTQTQLDIIKHKNDIAKQEMDFSLKQAAQNISDYKGQDVIALADGLYSGNLDKIYGYGESQFPDQFRSEEGQLLLSQRNQLIGQINLLASKDRPKGEGSVSDSERKTFAEAATILGNPNISPDAARKEIARIRGLMNKVYSRGGESLAPREQPAATPPQSGTINVGKYQVQVVE